MNKVKCVKCNWSGNEGQLKTFIDHDEVREFKLNPRQASHKGCPNCKTDLHLANVAKEANKVKA